MRRSSGKHGGVLADRRGAGIIDRDHTIDGVVVLSNPIDRCCDHREVFLPHEGPIGEVAAVVQQILWNPAPTKQIQPQPVLDPVYMVGRIGHRWIVGHRRDDVDDDAQIAGLVCAQPFDRPTMAEHQVIGR